MKIKTLLVVCCLIMTVVSANATPKPINGPDASTTGFVYFGAMTKNPKISKLSPDKFEAALELATSDFENKKPQKYIVVEEWTSQKGLGDMIKKRIALCKKNAACSLDNIWTSVIKIDDNGHNSHLGLFQYNISGVLVRTGVDEGECDECVSWKRPNKQDDPFGPH